MAFTMVRVIADYSLASGSEPVGTVTFIPDVVMHNGYTIPRKAIIAPLNIDGKIDQMLAATTDVTTEPVGVVKTYKVVEQIRGAVAVREWRVEIPHTASVVDGIPTVDLGSLTPIGG